MAYTELFRLNYRVGRKSIEEVYISGGALTDTIKTRLNKPKYVTMRLAPNTNVNVTETSVAGASLDAPNRLATITSFNYGSTTQFLVRFVGV